MLSGCIALHICEDLGIINAIYESFGIRAQRHTHTHSCCWLIISKFDVCVYFNLTLPRVFVAPPGWKYFYTYRWKNLISFSNFPAKNQFLIVYQVCVYRRGTRNHHTISLVVGVLSRFKSNLHISHIAWFICVYCSYCTAYLERMYQRNKANIMVEWYKV